MTSKKTLSAVAALALVFGVIAVSAPSATHQTTTVKVAKSKLGTILVDSHGRTLYLYTLDTNGSSSCTNVDRCYRTWPPLMATGTPHAGRGVDPILLGTVHRIRPSGRQVTYNGHPLYRYSQDTKAGQIKGQTLLSLWYVVSAAGAPIKKK
jgi:predicted lipoprotein with Yx(FWY)xxD motif